jgi:hypothetical protein
VRNAKLKTPTIRGFIEVSFAIVGHGPAFSVKSANGLKQSKLSVPMLELNVTIPANTVADLCIPEVPSSSIGSGSSSIRNGHGRHENMASATSSPAPELSLDGVRTPAVRRAGYLCVLAVGAAAHPRRVAAFNP